MKEFSKEVIEIDNKEYTLFINRKAIVSWENITKFSEKAENIKEKYKNISEFKTEKNEVEVSDNDNPFDYANEEFVDIDEDEKLVRDIYIKFYWIALYENHKLPLSEVNELFVKAEEEYGIEQLIELANQMVEDANKNKYGNTELKKLTALHQTK